MATDAPHVAPPLRAPRGLAGYLRLSRYGQTFSSLQEPAFTWYFAGNIAFFMGMQMQMILRGYIAFDLTNSSSALGLMAAAMALPMLVASPFGGVVADRVNKRSLLIVTQSLAAAASLAVALLLLADALLFWHLVVISVATGCLFSFNMPARQALVPLLVPQHRLLNAISLQMGSMNATRIIAPAVAGLLIAPIGVGWVYMITFLMFCLAVASEFRMPKVGMKNDRVREPFMREFTGGFRYIANDPTVRLLMILALVMPIFGFPVQQMLPVFADEVFDNGGFGLGMLGAATGIGGLTGAVIAANMENRQQKGRLLLLGGAMMGGFLLLFALTSNFVVALCFLVAMGIGQMLFQAVNNTAIQSDLPPDVRGRVMAVMMMSFGLMPLGAVPIGIAADAWGAQTAVAISACCLLAALAITWVSSPRLRHLRGTTLEHVELSPVRAAELVAEGKLTRDEADRLTGMDRFRPAK